MPLTKRVGNITFTSRLGDIQATVEREAEIRVREMGTVVRTEALRVLSGPRHGRFYRIPGTHRERRSGKARFRTAQAPKGGWQAGAETETGAASLLSTGTGVKGRRGFYRASAPGEAPAQRLARLRQSIRMFIKRNRESVSAYDGSDLDYAAYLEKGTKRMAARPWLIVAFNNMLGTLRTIATRKVPL